MSLETAQYIHQLNPSNPSGADRLKDGDDHLRMIKSTLKATFPGVQGPLDPAITHTFLNNLVNAIVPSGVIVMWSGTEATVPTGWAICDGRVVTASDGVTSITTPFFQDRVPSGVSSTRAVNSLGGDFSKSATTEVGGSHGHNASTATGGAHTHNGKTQDHALTTDEIPAHSHYEFANAVGTYDNLQNSPEGAPNRGGTGSSSGASYNISGSGSPASVGRSGNTGGGSAHSHGIDADNGHTHGVSIEVNAGHSHTVTVNVEQPTRSVYFIMKI